MPHRIGRVLSLKAAVQRASQNRNTPRANLKIAQDVYPVFKRRIFLFQPVSGKAGAEYQA